MVPSCCFLRPDATSVSLFPAPLEVPLTVLLLAGLPTLMKGVGDTFSQYGRSETRALAAVSSMKSPCFFHCSNTRVAWQILPMRDTMSRVIVSNY